MTEVFALKTACDEHDGLDQPTHIAMGAPPTETVMPTLLWRAGEALVGVLTLQDGWPPEACLLVHPQNRRRGIGRALVEEALALCHGDGHDELLLTTHQDSPSGRAFVDALGAVHSHAEYGLQLDRLPAQQAWSPRLVIEPAGLGDLDVVTAVLSAAFGDPVETRRERVAVRLQEANGRTFVAMLDGQPIGTIRLAAAGYGAYITSFGVRPEMQGRGFGRQLLTRVVQLATNEGLAPILIEVATDNRGALALYESCGFQIMTAYGYHQLQVRR